jgi:hypothetical protein
LNGDGDDENHVELGVDVRNFIYTVLISFLMISFLNMKLLKRMFAFYFWYFDCKLLYNWIKFFG